MYRVLAIGILALASLACKVTFGGGSVGNISNTPQPFPTLTNTALPTVANTPTQALAISPTLTPPISEITALQSLTVRSGPSEHAQALAWPLRGATVTLTGKCEEGWAQIKWPGIVPPTAWVKAYYISGGFCK